MKPTTAPAVEGLQAARAKDTQARRQRVLDALNRLQTEHREITVSSVARAARVHRSFLHRHPELSQAVKAVSHESPGPAPSTAVNMASLQAEVANTTAAHRRLAAHTRQLEIRLSELLGTAVAHAAGLDKSPSDSDIGQLTKRLHDLEEQVTDLKLQLAERTDELNAARLANRALMTANNQVS